ncbi:MAG TPA: hypothetical protein VF170_06495 [Planctomycetaceae bacterium]
MSDEKRPRWTWIATALVVGPLLYVLSDGPAMYCVEMGWLEFETFLAVWGPLPEVFGLRVVDEYESWWCELARSHGGPGR